MGCLDSLARIRNLARRGHSFLERWDTIRVGEDRFPVLAVVRVHTCPEHEQVDIRDESERRRPGIRPVLFSLWSLDEAIQRHLKCSDHFSRSLECHMCSLSTDRFITRRAAPTPQTRARAV